VTSGLLPTAVLSIPGSSSPFGQLPGGLAPVGLPFRVLPPPGTSPVVLPAAPQIGPALGPSSSLIVAPAQLVAPPQPGSRPVDHGKQKAAGRTAGAKTAAKATAKPTAKPTAKAPLARAAVSTKPVRASRAANALRASPTPAARTTEPGRVTMVRPGRASKRQGDRAQTGQHQPARARSGSKAHHNNVGAEHRPVKAHRSNAGAGRHRSVKAHVGKAQAGKARPGRVRAGKARAGQHRSGKARAGKAHAAKAHAGKAHAGKAHAGKAQHGAKGGGRSHRR